jgi:Transcription factor WhiB
MDGRSEALSRLMQRIFEHEQSGRLIPCVNPKLADWWLSEDLEMQEAAALACSTCPALRNCREYVEQWPEGGGVWAGILPPRRGVRNSSRDRLSRGDQ